MAVKVSESQTIKLEATQEAETITDIQNYLNTFNKEIGGDNVSQQVGGKLIFSELFSIVSLSQNLNFVLHNKAYLS